MDSAITAEEQALFDAISPSPLPFIEGYLGETLDPQQRGFLDALSFARRIAVKSGHSCGKDWGAARAALWFHLTHYPSIVVTTGPTDRQVRKVVWGEIRSAYMRAAKRNPQYPIGGDLLDTALKSVNPKHYMIGYTADDPGAFQGLHSENVLVVVTEAQAVPAPMWVAIESLLTAPKAKLLLIGNATYEPDSEFYQAFTSKAALYERFTLDSRQSSHCSREWIDEMRQVHGEGSAVWQARVEGIFPTDIADTLIPLGWIEKAQERYTRDFVPNHDYRTLGVDVARFGSDYTVFYLGEGSRYRCVHVAQGQDLMETCGQIVLKMREHKIPAANVRIDDTGLGGGVTDRLKELGHKVTAINFGSAATREEDCANARAEMFLALKERFRTNDIAIDPKDQRLLRDLSVLRYKQTSKGQLQMEAKAEAKRKLGYSPDRADALALAALPPAIADGLATGRVSSAGLLEFMRRKAEAAGKTPEAVGKRPAAEVHPDAARLLEGNRSGQPIRPPGPDPRAFFPR